MTGAIGLAGLATLRGGAGLVTLAVPQSCQVTVASFEPSYMTISLPEDKQGRICASAIDQVADMLGGFTSVGLGPGLGQSANLTEFVRWAYATIKLPMVVDADALNGLASSPEVLERPGGQRVLTPHPGEFSRLTAQSFTDRGTATKLADECARRWKAVILLKGNQTHVTQGEQSYTNMTGNSGMATGGAGDVLTGLITALLCQGLTPLDAAALAAHLHGLAGDIGATDLGKHSLIASDLIHYLPPAFKRYGADRAPPTY